MAADITRRSFLRFGAVAGAGASLSGATLAQQQAEQADASRGPDAPDTFNQATIAQLQAAMWPTDLINGDNFEFATSGLAAIVGYPIVNVPMGNVFGVPLGISFIGTAFSANRR
jgi:Asp-tRNA(Asn)/Glu-tRNA(Gln) amidotransferase A subunit family amidase